MKTFDRSIINSYLIRKYGRKVVNMLGRTLEEENELIRKCGERTVYYMEKYMVKVFKI